MKKALSTILAASMILASAYAASDDTPATIPEKPAPIVYKQRREKTAEEVAVGAKFLGHSSAMFMGTYVAQNGISQSDLVARLSNKRHEA